MNARRSLPLLVVVSLCAPAQGADLAALCKASYAAEMAYATTMDSALTRCTKTKDRASCDLGLAMFAGFHTNPIKDLAVGCVTHGFVSLSQAEVNKGVKVHQHLADAHGPTMGRRLEELAAMAQEPKP